MISLNNPPAILNPSTSNLSSSLPCMGSMGWSETHVIRCFSPMSCMTVVGCVVVNTTPFEFECIKRFPPDTHYGIILIYLGCCLHHDLRYWSLQKHDHVLVCLYVKIRHCYVKLGHTPTFMWIHCRGYEHWLCINCRWSRVFLIYCPPLFFFMHTCKPLYFSIELSYVTAANLYF